MVYIHIMDCQNGYKMFVATITSCAKHACVHTSFLVLKWQLVLLWCLKKPSARLKDTNNTFYAREPLIYNLFVNIVNLEYPLH